MKTKAIIFIKVVFFTTFLFSCFEHNNFRADKHSNPIVDEGPVSALIENTLKDVNDSIILAFQGKKLFTSSLIKEFYRENNNRPVWTSGMEPNHNSRQLIRLLQRAQYYGLDTSFYQVKEINELYTQLTDKNISEQKKKTVEFEFLMTHNCFKLMSHLKYGLLNADTSLYGKQPVKYTTAFTKTLINIIQADKLIEGILDLQPKSYEYRRLQKGLEEYYKNNTLSNVSLSLPDPQKEQALAYQKAGSILMAINYLDMSHYSNIHAEFMLEKIRKIGPDYLENKEEYSYYYQEDTVLINALKKFQLAHGLNPDGKIGSNTRKALLLNNRERFEQIAVNLERLKWEKNRPPRYVYVNVPSYKLRVIDEYKIVKTFNVVVGAKSTETPLLNSKIEYFITNPDWYVPFSISSKEILPKVKKDSTYLKRHNFITLDKDRIPVSHVEWSTVENSNFNYFFQQAPGDGNALGKIKFYFENPYIVYIHDTNDKGKFRHDIRAFSHGCIRIQEPGEFAKSLLKLEPNPLADSVDNWLTGDTREKVDFAEPIPLFVRYLTCEANENGQITFYQDIYNKDKKLKQALFNIIDL